VKKGFAIISGILITGFAQYFLNNEPLTGGHWIALTLVIISTYIHTNYPYIPPKERAKKAA